jgi:hypothetical protein
VGGWGWGVGGQVRGGGGWVGQVRGGGGARAHVQMPCMYASDTGRRVGTLGSCVAPRTTPHIHGDGVLKGLNVVEPEGRQVQHVALVQHNLVPRGARRGHGNLTTRGGRWGWGYGGRPPSGIIYTCTCHAPAPAAKTGGCRGTGAARSGRWAAAG